MKRLITIFLLAVSFLCNGQDATLPTVKIRGTRLAYPLVNKWISEFKKVHPEIDVKITPDAPADSISFSIASYPLNEKDIKEDQTFNTVSQYVQVLVVNSQRPGLKEWQAKGITEDELGALFFPTTPTLVASQSNDITSYIRDRPVCAVKAFASHYDADTKSLAGTAIKGDDLDLTESVKSDVNGISFNNLGFIYDVKTRRVKDKLAVIPLDLNKNGKVDKEEQHYATLDKLVSFIEESDNKAFVVSPVNFLYKKNLLNDNSAARTFLEWVYASGQNFNHELGFLQLKREVMIEQATKVNTLTKK